MSITTLKTKVGRKPKLNKEPRSGQSFFFVQSTWSKLDDLCSLENRHRTNMMETLIQRAHREQFGNAQEVE